MRQDIKFMNALKLIANFVFYDRAVFDRHTIERVEHENGVSMSYCIEGHLKGSDVPVKIFSRGHIEDVKGAQIEIYEGDTCRMFPVYGFNWSYLTMTGRI